MPPLVIYYPDQIQKNDEVPSLLFEIKKAYLWFLFYYPSMKLPSHSLSRSTPAMNSRTSTRWRLFYFIFLITGILVGIGLIIIWIGIPILLLMMLAWYGFSVFEKQLSVYILKAEIPAVQKPENTKMSIWARFKKHLSDPVTWKSLAFLFLRFPLGVLSFAITVSLLMVTLSFISAPFTYNYYKYSGSWLKAH